MTFSTGTPEEQPSSCPLCGANVDVETSVILGDATCSSCGQSLWFVQSPGMRAIFGGSQELQLKNRIMDMLATRLGVDRATIPNNSNLMSKLGVDSLDTVEFVMALEEGFDS